MANLTLEQLRFLDQADVPLSRVFDASGLRKSDYEQLMSDLGFWIAYGVNPCKAKGHTLKTRVGHCAQCNPANISYLRRHDEDGQVYTAISPKSNLVKVGASKNAKDRIRHLNAYKYGGQSDWNLVLVISDNNAGRVEALAHKALTHFAIDGTYYKNGRQLQCRELFFCSIELAEEGIRRAQKAVQSGKALEVLSNPVSSEDSFGVQCIAANARIAPPQKRIAVQFKAKPVKSSTPTSQSTSIPPIVRAPVPGATISYDWPRRSGIVPFAHQIETTEFLIKHNDRAFCLNDMGLGKSLSTLWAFDYLKRSGIVKSMLVICPLSTMWSTWADEVDQNFRGILRRQIIYDGDMSRLRALSQPADVYLINPDGLKTKGMVKAFEERPDIDLIVIDEIAQYARNLGTDRFKALTTIINRQMPRRAWGLTGTPTPNTPTDAWAQCRLLVPHRVPPYFNRFKMSVMRQVSRFLWVPQGNSAQIVADAMQPSIRKKREDCIDLPDCIYETRKIPLSRAQKEMYDCMLRRLHTELDGKTISATNELVKAIKLLQIAAGAPYDVNGSAVLPPMPERLEALVELVDEAEGKIIIFAPYRSSIEVIREYLTRKFSPEHVAVIHGGIGATRRTGIFSQFQKNDQPRILVAQAQAMSHGLTLTAANTIVWFGPTTSAQTYSQANARISRPGQKRTQFIVHIEGCEIERRIFERVRNKESLQRVLLDLLAQYCGTKVQIGNQHIDDAAICAEEEKTYP
ncbi:MAG: hypothetical protein EG825_02635 [Rhodocyclaceae bacterium]|nr:hypothetical protein [Rhodocyclaceae bacterium]